MIDWLIFFFYWMVGWVALGSHILAVSKWFLIYSLINFLLIGWLIDWLVDWLVTWSIVWLFNWLLLFRVQTWPSDGSTTTDRLSSRKQILLTSFEWGINLQSVTFSSGLQTWNFHYCYLYISIHYSFIFVFCKFSSLKRKHKSN